MPTSLGYGVIACFWISCDMSHQGAAHTILTFPKDKQSASSWSWASMNRIAVLEDFIAPINPLAEIITAEAYVKGANPFGEVSGGQIQIRGRIQPCWVYISSQENIREIYYHKPDGTESNRQYFYPDGQLVARTVSGSDAPVVHRSYGPEPLEIHGSAMFLTLAQTPWINYKNVGLVISRLTETSSCFERVGQALNMPKDWYEEGQLVDLTMI